MDSQIVNLFSSLEIQKDSQLNALNESKKLDLGDLKEDRLILSDFLEDHLACQLDPSRSYNAKDLTPFINSSKPWPFKRFFRRICQLTGLIYLKNCIYRWRHRDEKYLAIKEINNLSNWMNDIENNILHATSFLDIVNELNELSQIQNVLKIQAEDYIRILGKAEFDRFKKSYNLEKRLKNSFENGKRKAIANFEHERLRNLVIQKNTLEWDGLITEAKILKELIFLDTLSPLDAFNPYKDSIDKIKQIQTIKQKLEKGLVHKILDQRVLDIYLFQIDTYIKESKQLFFERALRADIQSAIDHKLIPSESKLETLVKNPNIHKHFKKVHQLRLQKHKNPKNRTDNAHLLARKVSKAKFAFAVGVQPIISDKGVNGAKFLKSVTNKFLGVFKGPNPEKIGYKQYLKQLGLTQQAYLHDAPYVEIVAEKAAYLIALKMNSKYLTLAPTRITTYGNTIGDFLVWQDQCVLASTVASQINKKTTFTEDELNRFQMFAVFDFLLGNLDRHEDNWMVKMNGDTIEKIIPIDNANILPKQEISHYINYCAGFSVYKWSQFFISRSPFTEETIATLAALSDNFVDEICEEIKKDPEILSVMNLEAEFPSDEAKAEMKRRFNILKAVAEGKITSPYELSGY